MSGSGTVNLNKQVAIFGAGIAGLTAAHELIERGFDVEVYERDKPSVLEDTAGAPCAIGGMARTQWSRVEQSNGEAAETHDAGWRSTQPLRLFPRQKIRFKAGEIDPTGDKDLEAKLDELVEDVTHYIYNHGPVKCIEVRGFSDELLPGPDPDLLPPGGLDLKRALAVQPLLESRLQKAAANVQVTAKGYGPGYGEYWAVRPEDRNYVSFHVVEDWIPGEHGFRFFPSFYRNLFDTMRRTPIPDENQPIYQETPRTVLDNIMPTEFMGICTKSQSQPFPLRRTPPTSLQEVFDEVRSMLGSLGLTLADQTRFQLKLFKYMTTCAQRREQEYEHVSWWDFLEADQFSEAFQKYADSTAQALVAMDAHQSDARTYGNISIQMLQDQFAGRARTDGTLNGPTSLVWFDHWRRYLETQGVRFYRGKLKSFEVFDDNTYWPRVEIRRPYDEFGKLLDEPRKVDTVLVRDYYVIAIPGEALQQIVDKNPKLRGGDFDKVRTFPFGSPDQANPDGALEHMSGIQYYFANDFKMLEGHTIFPDSEWRLSSISQPQFWTKKRGWWSGYRGVLSVDVSDWETPSPAANGKAAWRCTKDEIAKAVWKQIKDALEERVKGIKGYAAQPESVEQTAHSPAERPSLIEGAPPPRLTLPEPLFYHLDENIKFGKERDATPTRNQTPLLINRVDEYGRRPGRLNREEGYKMHAGIVFAGTYMQTYTRLTTMEAANESGRHAVNAILNDYVHKNQHPRGFEWCRIADPEDNEPQDLRFLVDLDRRLLELGLPHFLDILDLRTIPPGLLCKDPDLSVIGLNVPGVAR